jgi:hypothetical protein
MLPAPVRGAAMIRVLYAPVAARRAARAATGRRFLGLADHLELDVVAGVAGHDAEHTVRVHVLREVDRAKHIVGIGKIAFGDREFGDAGWNRPFREVAALFVGRVRAERERLVTEDAVE